MLNRYRGCLLGLAIGDALGAPVEFMSLSAIKSVYGEDGIRDFDSWQGFPAGSYTDDTQMALATATGCIEAYYDEDGEKSFNYHAVKHVYREYLKWIETQDDLFHRRAPGNTCLNALRSGKMGTPENRINLSKGCGGAMRTAPAGLAFSPGQAFEQGAKFAAITHGHPAGFMTAGFIAELIANIVAGEDFDEAIKLSVIQLTINNEFEETLEKVQQALTLSSGKGTPEEDIRSIGGGWVGEEALGIALYCSARFEDDFSGGVLASVNHSGDSDSTGSITGAILGTLLGDEAIPAHWVENVEDTRLIQGMASQMHTCFSK